MTPRDIAKLCCRVMAIYALIIAISALPAVVWLFGPFLSDAPMHTLQILWNLLNATQPFLLGLFAWLLWKKAGLVAAWMTGYNIQDNIDEPECNPLPAGLRDIHAIAFSTIGLWVLLDVIPQAIHLMIDALFRLNPGFDQSTSDIARITAGSWGDLILRLLLGGWLLFGGRGLVDILHKLRRIGLKDETAEPATTKNPPDSHSNP